MDDLEAGVDGDGREHEACMRDAVESEETEDGGDSFGGAGGGDPGAGGGNLCGGNMNEEDAEIEELLFLRRASLLLFLNLFKTSGS